MELHKTVCQNSQCGYVRFWTGYKTGIGKSPEQLVKMDKDYSICVKCGATNADTDIDYESKDAKSMDEAYKDLFKAIFG